MRRTIFVLLVVIAAASWLGYYSLQHVQSFKQTPLVNSLSYNNIARVATDPTGGFLIIHKSKQELIKVLPSGILDYQLTSPKRGNVAHINLTNMTVDPQGNVYVLLTELDEYGLFVKGEQINRYTSTGKLDKVIKSYTYDESDGEMLRVGKLKGLQYLDDHLAFFTVDEQAVQLQRYHPTNDQWGLPLEINLTNNSHISEI